jgi:hypothetical protein
MKSMSQVIQTLSWLGVRLWIMWFSSHWSLVL